MSEVQKIAESLTDEQRTSIMQATDLMSNHGGYPFFTVRFTGDPWPEGVAQFLTLISDRLTELGLVVRSHLLSQKTR